MPTLYVAPGACSFGAHVALKALDIPHTIKVVPLRQPDSPIYTVNPQGRVPALVLDDGAVITENSAILPYIADLKPEAGLNAPLGSVDRARIQEWIGFLNSDLHGAFRPLNRPALFHTDEATHDTIRRQGKTRLFQLLDTVEKKVPENAWLVGNRFTVADAYLGVFTRWVRRRDFDWAQWPNLKKFADRFDVHPAVIAAEQAEKAV
ncbi:MAG: glutathione binding-like protein [Pseudomonadota bacterium]